MEVQAVVEVRVREVDEVAHRPGDAVEVELGGEGAHAGLEPSERVGRSVAGCV